MKDGVAPSPHFDIVENNLLSSNYDNIMKKVLLYVSFVTALVSCYNDKTAPRWEEKHNTREFGAVISMETYRLW